MITDHKSCTRLSVVNNELKKAGLMSTISAKSQFWDLSSYAPQAIQVCRSKCFFDKTCLLKLKTLYQGDSLPTYRWYNSWHHFQHTLNFAARNMVNEEARGNLKVANSRYESNHALIVIHGTCFDLCNGSKPRIWSLPQLAILCYILGTRCPPQQSKHIEGQSKGLYVRPYVLHNFV